MSLDRICTCSVRERFNSIIGFKVVGYTDPKTDEYVSDYFCPDCSGYLYTDRKTMKKEHDYDPSDDIDIDPDNELIYDSKLKKWVNRNKDD